MTAFEKSCRLLEEYRAIHPGEELPTEKESVLSKLKSYQAKQKPLLEKIRKNKRKRDGTIGLLGGFTRPKARMISGFSLKTSAIYGRIYFGVLYKKCQHHTKDMKGEEPWVIKQI